jgi:hypothetical protein
MAAEFHFAEDAFALHLLLQDLEGLVHIVVTDENLHWRSSSTERLIGWVTAALGPQAHIKLHNSGDKRHPRRKPQAIIDNVDS